MSELPATRPQRDPVTGRLLPGHTVTLKTGEYSTRVWRALLPGQEEQLARLGDRQAQLIADQGGAPECSQIRRDLLDSYNATTIFLEWSRERIVREGPFTGRGRTRAAVSLYLAMLDRQVKLGAMLGLERRTRGVASSPYEVIAKSQEAGTMHPGASSGAIGSGGESTQGGGGELVSGPPEARTAGGGRE